VEFSRDKITGLVLKRNPLDRYCHTCTVSFWSIGSGSAVNFQYIPYDDQLEGLMRAKAGIVADEALETIRPQFSFNELLRANLFSTLLAMLLLIASIIAALIWSLWIFAASAALLIIYLITSLVLHRRYRRASLRLGRYTTTVSIGILFRKQYDALHDNIKDVTLRKYPGSTLGTVQFNVAGERMLQGNQGQNRTIPNRFSIAYIPGIAQEVRGDRAQLDQVLLHKPSAAQYVKIATANTPKPVARRQTRPALKNSLAVIIPLHVILVPLIIFLPFTILLRRYYLRRVSYTIENDRVVARQGIIYRTQNTILFERIDYTETGQNFLNKLFKNGNLYLFTAGSSSAELTLTNMPDYQTFAHSLKSS
jgi:membrane protein YdbS with pleckstrin-like domain